MKVHELMIDDVMTCQPHDTLDVPARMMRDGDFGVVPVITNDERVVGIITDRDICMSALRNNAPLTDIKTREAMTDEIYFCSPEDRVEDAAATMSNHQVRRLPVLDDELRLHGILSINDVARAYADESGHFFRDLTPREVADTLADISEPAPDNAQTNRVLNVEDIETSVGSAASGF